MTMNFFRRRFVRVPVALALVVLHVGVFMPRQAHAVPALALVAAAALAGSAALATGGAQYYAPAVYEAGQKAANEAGQVARQLYRINKYVVAAGTSYATDYLFGRATSAYTATAEAAGAFADWVSGHASEVPLLFAGYTQSLLPGDPFAPGAVDESTPPLAPVGSVLRPEYISTSAGVPNGAVYTADQNYQLTTGWTAGSNVCAAPSSAYDIPCLTKMGSGNPQTLAYYVPRTGTCTGGNIPLKQWLASSVAVTDAPTQWPSGGLDPSLFGAYIDAGGAEVAFEIDRAIAARPQDWTIADTPSPAVPLAPGADVKPPPAWTADEIKPYIQPGELAWPATQPLPLPGQRIENPPVAVPGEATIPLPITVVNPGTGAPPIIHAGTPPAVISSPGPDGEAIPYPSETAPPTPDVPYTPAPVRGPYTLPDIDFGARFQQFITALRGEPGKPGSPIFDLPDKLVGLPPGGSSVISVDFGSTFGGVQSFDLASLWQLWVILQGVVTIAFGYVSIRIVTLKR